MMISPESYIDEYKDMPYTELLPVRDGLMCDIRRFEEDTERNGDEWMVMPSPDVRYQMNLQYLAKICELIAEKYNSEFICNDKGTE